MIGRCARHGASAVKWEDPQEYELYIQKHKGKAVIVALKNKDFAEFDPRRDVEEDGVLNSEDYLFEVLSLAPKAAQDEARAIGGSTPAGAGPSPRKRI